MPKLLKPGQLASLLRPGMRIFVQGSSSEPTALLQDLLSTPDACAGVEFISCQIPGLNRIDFAGLHPDATFTGLFITPEIKASYDHGKVRFMPLAYSGMYRYLESKPVDVALIQVTPTKKQGTFSLGISTHFVPAVLGKAEVVVAEINEELPSVGQSFLVDEGRLDYVMATGHAPPEVKVEPASEVAKKIAAHIAALMRDGDHVQIGIGKLPNAVLAALCSHRQLVCHGGLVSDGMIDLEEEGILDPSKPLVCTSVIGTKRLYDWVRERSRIHVHPVSYTHDIRVMAGFDRFVAINSAMSVDLHGQANAETANGRQVGGCGGLADFVRGARLSKDGCSIIALPSTAAGGTISRIVPSLSDDIASISRTDADYVVTEHGIADLRHKALEERAEALIQIAEPSFQKELFDRWRR